MLLATIPSLSSQRLMACRAYYEIELALRGIAEDQAFRLGFIDNDRVVVTTEERMSELRSDGKKWKTYSTTSRLVGC